MCLPTQMKVTASQGVIMSLQFPQPERTSEDVFLFPIVGKNNIKCTILTILSIQFSHVQYIHIVVRQISRTFPFCNTEILTHSTLIPPQPVATTFLLPVSMSLEYFGYRI